VSAVTLSLRASNAVWNAVYVGLRERIDWNNEPDLKRKFKLWLATHDLTKLRNCGVITRRELQAWIGIPVEPLPTERPRCKCCGQVLPKGGAK
jgi:hypothetical protein